MGAEWLRAGAQLRGRLLASLLLALVVGLAGGVVLAAVPGARRGAALIPGASRTTLAVVALALGLPLGLAARRWAWELTAPRSA